MFELNSEFVVFVNIPIMFAETNTIYFSAAIL